jgi:hypothetical protein
MRVASSDNNALLYLDSPAALGYSGVQFRSGGNSRWYMRKNYTAESGSNAGSNFELAAISDDGNSQIGIPLAINRATLATTLTGDLSISKASPSLTMTASSGSASIILQKPSGSNGLIYINNSTTGYARWVFGANNTAESGSNAGTNFAIYRYDDAGTSILGTALSITRSTGLTTLTSLTVSGTTTLTGNITATAGIDYGNSTYQKVKLGGTVIKRNQTGNYSGLEIIDGADAINCEIRVDGSAMFKGDITIDKGTNPTLVLGASGPKVMSGAGSPEGVVTAVVGSLYTRTNGGANTTLYVKESGTGNTGWAAK